MIEGNVVRRSPFATENEARMTLANEVETEHLRPMPLTADAAHARPARQEILLSGQGSMTYHLHPKAEEQFYE